jgi:predicted nucleotidyltransferase component of viral defense system
MNEAALKARLKFIAQEKLKTFNEVWKQLLLERFLARLSHSAYREQFIFKGGLLLAQYMELGRETTDIDFSMTKMKSEFSTIQQALCEIISVEIDDSFRFEWGNMQILSQPHLEYTGFRATMQACFDNMKDKIHIDIGVGDVVVASEKDYRPFEYNGKPLFVGEITMLVYPVESIFSEKLETIISKGSNNSRMKDYHDVMLMIKESGLLNPIALAEKLQATFKHRNTEFTVPIEFDDTEISQLQNLWTNHLRGLGDIRKKLDLPAHISDLLAEINGWLTNLQKTIDAMKEAERAQLKSFKTAQSLMDNLNDNSD